MKINISNDSIKVEVTLSDEANLFEAFETMMGLLKLLGYNFEIEDLLREYEIN